MRETTDLGDSILCKTVDGIEVKLSKTGLTGAEKKCLTDGCFTGDTLVMTKEGLRRIDSMQEGDLVLAKNTKTGQLDYKPVIYVYRKSTRDFINLTVAGKLIETTSTHLFMLEDGNWKSAENLKAGDRIVTANGDIKTVDSVEAKYYNEARRIFNLNVDDFHTYFVGNDGLLVHNDCSEEMAKMAEIITRLKELGATDEVISIIQKSEGVAGLDRLESLLQRYFSCDDIITLSKYGISTAEYEAKGISYSRVAENVSRMLNTDDSCVELYRAVSANEYDDLINTQKFNVVPGAYSGKQFGFKFDEILKLSSGLQDSVAIFKVKIPKEVFAKFDFTPVDTFTLKNGSLTVEKGTLLDLLNGNIKELVHVF